MSLVPIVLSFGSIGSTVVDMVSDVVSGFNFIGLTSVFTSKAFIHYERNIRMSIVVNLFVPVSLRGRVQKFVFPAVVGI